MRQLFGALVFMLVVAGGPVMADEPPVFILSWPGGFGGCVDVAVGPDGSVYLTGWLGHRVKRFTGEGVLIDEWGSYGSGPGEFGGPAGLAGSRSGDVRTDTMVCPSRDYEPLVSAGQRSTADDQRLSAARWLVLAHVARCARVSDPALALTEGLPWAAQHSRAGALDAGDLRSSNRRGRETCAERGSSAGREGSCRGAVQSVLAHVVAEQ